MSAPVFPHAPAFPRWVAVIERWRHIFERNQSELAQITFLWALGFWWMLPGSTWSLEPYADLRFAGIGEERCGLAMIVVASLHYAALWRRRYAFRRGLSAIAAMFWFSLGVVALHAAPHSSEIPVAFVMGLSVATTFWRLGGK